MRISQLIIQLDHKDGNMQIKGPDDAALALCMLEKTKEYIIHGVIQANVGGQRKSNIEIVPANPKITPIKS